MYFSIYQNQSIEVIESYPRRLVSFVRCQKYLSVRFSYENRGFPLWNTLDFCPFTTKKNNVPNLDTLYQNIHGRFGRFRSLPCFVGKNSDSKNLKKIVSPLEYFSKIFHFNPSRNNTKLLIRILTNHWTN